LSTWVLPPDSPSALGSASYGGAPVVGGPAQARYPSALGCHLTLTCLGSRMRTLPAQAGGVQRIPVPAGPIEVKVS